LEVARLYRAGAVELRREEAANATDGGRIWGVVALVFLALGLWALWSGRRRA
jgi:hypothetical protein